jgi:LuxR family maltose regulon positive regulatory protein
MPPSPRPPVEDQTLSEPSVDTVTGGSLSFAQAESSIGSPLPNGSDREIRHAPIAVGPGYVLASSALPSGGLPGAMPEFPIQISKVQPPPLRDQTLARDRLLEWLGVKIHDRVVLLTAEAGYGKTTLLADFARRSRVRCLWFRLDRGDRDWVGFVAHLVAAVRVHVPEFGPATDQLLRETASAAPPLDTVLNAFLRELATLPPDASALIFDDFHLVDDAPQIRHIAKELLARAPERLSFVFASRRTPPVRLARLRSLGEVAELSTDDLRFDPTETERLFRETYEMKLEPGLIAELTRRTEGWAASLQLVRTALHDRDPGQVRAFISSLSGAEGHLYDYLAEEVVGDLPLALQEFLMGTSLLETIDLDLGPVAADIPVITTRDLIDEGERLGLFGRHGVQTRYQVRAHPLVREFLRARLARSVGAAGVVAIHRRVAEAAESLDWRVATHHYFAAGDEASARRVLSASIETILATGAYAAAEAVEMGFRHHERRDPAVLIVASRMAMQRADPDLGLQLAEQAWEADQGSTAAILNLVSARTFAGDLDGAVAAGRLLEQSDRGRFADLGRVHRLVIESSLRGSLVDAERELQTLAFDLAERRADHFLGVSLLNQASIRIGMGDPLGAVRSAEKAISLLESTSAGVELASARFARASALAHLGDLEGCRDELSTAMEGMPRGQGLEAVLESAAIEIRLGDADRARRILDSVNDQLMPDSDSGQQALFLRGLLHLRLGKIDAAKADLGEVRPGVLRTTVAFEAQRLIAESEISLLEGDPKAADRAREARSLATLQGARLWESQAALIEAFASTGGAAEDAILRMDAGNLAALSMSSELVIARLDEFGEEATARIATEAARRPARWRPSLRQAVEIGPTAQVLSAGPLLEEIGEGADVHLLRSASRRVRDAKAHDLGRKLARKLAPRVVVEDLGRVRVLVGDRAVEGSDVRRKVLALLCLLVSKGRFSSTREEVLESLWPDLDPGSALNSLNQTVYFLRRLFEPEYREETSPGYVLQDGETIWLDTELIEARSRRCRKLIRLTPAQADPAHALVLAEEYRGKFALDFAYDEWSSSYRDSLHASYLRVIEQAIRFDIDRGQFERGTAIAEKASEVEPESEEIQLALIRLYRLTGAHGAAAEQYGHYANSLRDLGVDPPAFAEV